MIPERLDVTDRSLASFGGTEVMGAELRDGSGWDLVLSMVQKSHSQPPGMVLKPCK